MSGSTGLPYEVQQDLDLALEPPELLIDPPGYHEAALDYGMNVGIERTGTGRLWLAWVGGGDNDQAFLMLATSDDAGETWSDPRPSSIRQTSSRHAVRQLASGTFLLIKHGRRHDHAADGRSELTAFVSSNGSNWTGGLVLDQRTDISYPDIAELPDGTIVVSYDHQRSALGEILIARFTESDVRQAEARSPMGALLHIASITPTPLPAKIHRPRPTPRRPILDGMAAPCWAVVSGGSACDAVPQYQMCAEHDPGIGVPLADRHLRGDLTQLLSRDVDGTQA